jgi:hypothetical protein
VTGHAISNEAMKTVAPLVYLDHSTIVHLERVLKRDHSRFDEFVAAWESSGCVLTLSMFHVLEICGSKHADSRRVRLKVLERLAPAKVDVVPSEKIPGALQHLEGREIFYAIGRKFGQNDQIRRLGRGGIAFPFDIPAAAFPLMLRHVTSAKARKLVKQFHDAVVLGARARTTGMSVTQIRHRLGDLLSGPIMPDQVVAAQSGIDDVLASREWNESIAAAFPPQYRSEATDTVRRWLLKFSERIGDIGPREAFAEHVEADLPGSLKSYTDELIKKFVFRQAVENTAKEVLVQLRSSELGILAESIAMQDCPGTWLRYAVEGELQRARSTWEPGATYDLMHLAHLPYVDLLFCDAEIANNTAKVLRRKGLPLLLEHVHPPVAVSSSIDEIQRVILDLSKG